MTKQAKVEVVLASPDETNAKIVLDEAGNKVAETIVDEAKPDTPALPKLAIKNADGTVTLPLRLKVDVRIRDHNGKERTDTYDKLTFHHLTGADIRAVQAAAKDMVNVVAFARATKISQNVMNVLFDKMHGADVNDGGEIIAAFMNGGL